MEAAKKQSNMLPLVERLSREPLVVEFQLASLSLSKLVDEIDRADQKVDAITDDDVRKERLKASAERCRESYALLLLEIPVEEMPSIQTKTLTELMASSAPAPALQAVPEPSLQMETAPEVEPAKPAPPPPPAPSMKPLPPKIPGMKPAPKAPPARVTLPTTEDEIPEVTAIGIPVPLPAPSAPAAPAILAGSETAGELNEQTHPTLPSLQVVLDKLPKSPVPAARNELARELLDLCAALEAARPALPEKHLGRLLLQHQLMALEMELRHTLHPGFQKLWPLRKAEVLRFLEPASQTLLPATQTFFKTLQSQQPAWIHPHGFTLAWLQVMLRYWLTEVPVEAFKPSLAESSFALCLFGQAAVAGLDCSNTLSVSGVSPEELKELACRLARLQKIRNSLLSSADSAGIPVDVAQADIAASFAIVQKLRCDGGQNG